MMRKISYILCHGSGNRFVMVDAVQQADVLATLDLSALAEASCRLCGGLDGLLLLVKQADSYGMRMFNPDGSEAEMCGNGIRCVARLARERYLSEAKFSLFSGRQTYAICQAEPIYGSIPTYGVDIAIRTASPDFRCEEPSFVGRLLPELDEKLHFTYLNLGNPHLVAAVDAIDYDQLEQLGRRVLMLTDRFPKGVNVSLFQRLGEERIFVATYERGVGITASCGTAMTASSTAACLNNLCRFDHEIEVNNRGGRVRCLCRQTTDGLLTRLTGNATCYADGWFEVAIDGTLALAGVEQERPEEVAAYDAFLRTL